MSEPSSPRSSGAGGSSPPPSPPAERDIGHVEDDLAAVSLASEPATPPTPTPVPIPLEKDEANVAILNSPPPPTPPKLESPVDLTVNGSHGDSGSLPSSPASSSSSRLQLGSPSQSSESISSRRQQVVEPLQLTTTRSAQERDMYRTGSNDNDRPPRPSTPPRQHTPTIAVLQSPGSPRSVMSNRFRSMPVSPSVAVKDEDDDEEPDPTAPFESVPLDDSPSTTAAIRSASSALEKAIQTPGTPGRNVGELPSRRSGELSAGGKEHERNSSRSSWTGSVKAAVSLNGARTSERASESSARPASPATPASATSFASGSSTARRHAPPAHPHPFPIPTSPLPSNVPVPQVVDPNAPGPSKAAAHGAGGAAVPTPGNALGVKGQSAFDKFMSRTRPSHLPPKDKAEDDTHLHEWENMMAKAREHEAERRRVAEARKIEREKHLLAVTPRWEALLKDRDVISKIKGNESNRKLWFDGVPPHMRGKAWSLAIGNALAMRRDAYNMYLKRAHRARDSGRFPPDIQNQMEEDMDNTLPILHVFQAGSPVRDELRDLVSAWVVYRSDDGQGYAPCITLLAAMFILVSPPQEAFLSLCNFLARPCMHAFYTETQDDIDAYYRVFENLQADMFPRIYANCKNLGLQLPESYFRSVLVEQVPFDTVCRLWDQIVLEGDGYVFRACLAIFAFLEPRLYYPDKEEIESVLEGRNAATMAIAERERERARLRGERYEEVLDGKLSVFGLHEDALFDWLANDGWRDSRFERLVMRELPD